MLLMRHIRTSLVAAFITLVPMVCTDFSAENSGQSTATDFRIPLGSCADFQDVAETFTNIYTNLLSQPAGGTSKGCAGANSCHSLATNLGGWNLGNNQAQAWSNLTTLNGISGRKLITANNIEASEIIIRLSVIINPMPKDGNLWFNSDLIAIKRWVCQGALNN
jgi:hypothetical protein